LGDRDLPLVLDVPPLPQSTKVYEAETRKAPKLGRMIGTPVWLKYEPKTLMSGRNSERATCGARQGPCRRCTGT
jgi:hypothetical protein